jgi:hypothetical protein
MIRGAIGAAIMLGLFVWFRIATLGWMLTIWDLVPATLGVIAGVLWVWRFTRYVSGGSCDYPRMSRTRLKLLQVVAITLGILWPGGLFVPGPVFLPPLFPELGLGGTVMFFAMSAVGLAWLIRYEAQVGPVHWSAPW